MNRNGDRPYSGNTLRNLLTDLAVRLDVRDSTGALVDFNRTHRFRHTVATGFESARNCIRCIIRQPRRTLWQRRSGRSLATQMPVGLSLDTPPELR